MRDTDVSVRHADAEFRSVKLAHPLTISGGSIAEITLAVVHATAVNRNGDAATGRGASILSVPWSWPQSRLTAQHRDTILRSLTDRLAQTVVGLPPADPIRIWCDLSDAVDQIANDLEHDEPVPRLAAVLGLAAVDNAVHDAWSRAAGRPAYAMYDGRHLGADLSALLGPAYAGRYPGDGLTAPRRTLPVQHVVGFTDPLRSDEGTEHDRSLAEWLRTERLRHLKIKLLGQDIDQDAERVVAVYELAQLCLERDDELVLAIDPNEAYAAPEAVLELLHAIRRRRADAARAIAYVEQPIPRGTTIDPAELGRVTSQVPVLMDEGLTTLSTLRGLAESGWSGAAVKASKGQTLALLTYSYAHAHGLYVTVQDLTAVDLALRHSARLASVLAPTSPHFEYNSRQYAPHANDELAKSHPDLVAVREGHIRIDAPIEPGLY